MTTSTLYFFVDTNLFIQCRPLEELDWSPWHEFEEVRLIVSKPVLQEIDSLKTKGGRVRKRARGASAMFREILDQPHKVIRARSPRVVLFVEPGHRPDPDLTDRLNYGERDDELIGTVSAFAPPEPDNEVRLLTHDTIPLYTARGLGLPANQIPDNWLLPPENTETERKLAALEAENARLKAAEPQFSIRCESPSGVTVDCYQASYTWYEPLTEAEVDSLVRRLEARFPLATDFGPRDPAEPPPPRPVASSLSLTRPVFVPATDEEIEKYQDEDYPRWLSCCEEALRTHHRTLQAEPPGLRFAFLVTNSGTRPAKDALVTIEACGEFEITPPEPDDAGEDQESDEDASGSPQSGSLPRPPVAPCGRWENPPLYQTGFWKLFEHFQRNEDMLTSNSQNAYIDRPIMKGPRQYSSFIRPASRDPNAFYYKPNRPTNPQTSFVLECAQWRHDNDAEAFIGEIQVPTDRDEAKGLLVCRIQAANLSKSVSHRIPVRIEIAHVRAFESARDMVQALENTPQFRVASPPPRTDSAE